MRRWKLFMSYEGGALVSDISDLMKQAQGSSLAHPTMR
jgi:hypothetical protein